MVTERGPLGLTVPLRVAEVYETDEAASAVTTGSLDTVVKFCEELTTGVNPVREALTKK